MKITSIACLVTQIEGGQLSLPAYKGPFRWNSQQTLEYIGSLYRGFPSGSLIFQPPTTVPGKISATEPAVATERVIDGHQRLAVIFGAVRGRAPDFSPESAALEWPLYYHVGREEFAFGEPAAKKDPFWINLPAFLGSQRPDTGKVIMSIYPHCSPDLPVEEVIRRVDQLANLINRRVVVEYMPDCASLEDSARISTLANCGRD
jgi:hypothetical protein